MTATRRSGWISSRRTELVTWALAACVVLGVGAEALAQHRRVGQDTGGITLELIMRDPGWIARSPTGAYWSDDGQAIYYRRQREGSELDDLYRLDLGSGGAVVVPDEELASADARGGDWDAARERKLFSRGGDLFIKRVGTGEETRLTRTTAGERSPRFMADEGWIAFTRGGTLLVRDLATGLESEPADVRFEEAPEKARENEDKDKDYLDRQQERYFEAIRDAQEDRQEREDRRRELRRVDAGDVPGPFYLPKGLKERRRSLSPDGAWMIVVAAKDTGDEERDTMPRFVTESGYVDSSRVRPKVGYDKREDQRVFLLDLRGETWAELDRAALPLIDDDPLAWLKERNEDSDAADCDTGDSGEKAEADGAGDNADEDDGSDHKEAADKAKPRPVNVMGVEWSPDGRLAALMFRSNDNKDRWIAVIDPAADEPGLEPAHHLRDEAWINWRFNEFGWREAGGGLWFLSEQSGYSHLYLWDPETGETTALTAGEWEASSVVESPADGSLVFVANVAAPIRYGVWRVHPDRPGQVVSVASVEGSVESFELSPGGQRVLLRASRATRPSELYTKSVMGRDAPRPVTDTVRDEYLDLPWVEPEFVEIEGVHGRPIWTKVYAVEGAWDGASGERPGVVFVHGAGYTQNSDDAWPYYFREQMFHSMLARLGYVVIDMDYRASSGYGRDWRTAIYRDMGRPELEDFAAGIDWMVGTHGVDPERIGVYGGSYGGFMTLMALFLEPERYACGAALRPVTDWAHYNHGYTSNILNTPELDPEAFERSSPIEHAEGLADPLLMCHGMVDDNVVFQDTVRLAQKLIELGKTDWEVAIYPIEPHSFTEAASWLDEYRRVFALFEEHLRAPAAPQLP